MGNIFDRTVFLVDDEPELRRMVEQILKDAGFRDVLLASSCQEARRIFRTKTPELVLLDVMLLDGDGFSLLEEFRESSDLPVIFLSARDEDENRLRGLGLGADDYITKPFLPRELVLRVSAVLRRVYRDTDSQQQLLNLGSVIVDWGSGTATSPSGQQTLTAKEYAILRKLNENRGHIVTIDSLCQTVWEGENFGYENTLIVHIRRLREKIEVDPSHPQYLLTVRGLGYKLAKEAKE